ncbi:phosphoribosyl-ATP diphosphatase [Spirochaeta lutea]|uniref:Phosphoribosyl-ATP pyrophosphatase n=1 Tax=Spirochaeta lutea TaxID=1480694 RepID=A0A098QYF9_9SPIO|nr:phosphoribosyl-ATP diphosphatase [Spirochaeta lutea]KGE71527.1 hypothetical protein DC28_09495 [Spirochaeta lutea]
MQTPEKDGAVQPLIIENTGGDLLSAGLINTKGIQKSLEQGGLWTLDGSTGRLLPLSGAGKLQDLRQERGMVRAVVTGFEGAPQKQNGGDSNAGPTTPAPGDQEAVTQPEETQADPGQVMTELQDLIRQRKIQMPEGSYTTHLFSKGEEKIRKKTGEEAVEILLARSDEELVYESADFLYHLLVLFVQRGIDFNTIFQELARR